MRGGCVRGAAAPVATTPVPNEESFSSVRHAYFLCANDPCKALKTTLKAEINEDAWATLNSGPPLRQADIGENSGQGNQSSRG